MLSAVVPDEHVRALDRLAKRRGVSRSEVMRDAIAWLIKPQIHEHKRDYRNAWSLEQWAAHRKADADRTRARRRAERAA